MVIRGLLMEHYLFCYALIIRGKGMDFFSENF